MAHVARDWREILAYWREIRLSMARDFARIRASNSTFVLPMNLEYNPSGQNLFAVIDSSLNRVDTALMAYLERWGKPYGVVVFRNDDRPLYFYTLRIDTLRIADIHLNPDPLSGIKSRLTLILDDYHRNRLSLAHRLTPDRANAFGDALLELLPAFARWFPQLGDGIPTRNEISMDAEFAAYYRARQQGKGFTLADIARRTGYSKGYVRQLKMDYDRRIGRKKRQPNNPDRST